MPKVDAHKCHQVIFDKRAKTTSQKTKVFSINDVGNVRYQYAKQMILNTHLTVPTKINSYQIIHLNVKRKTAQFLGYIKM